jgi:hypothetical protein
MRHVPLITFDSDDRGEHVAITTACTCGEGSRITIPTAHIGALMLALFTLGDTLGVSMEENAATVLTLSSVEERREIEERFAEYLRTHREPDHSG